MTDPVAATATHNVDIQADQMLSILQALEGVFGGDMFSVQDIVAVAKKAQRSEAEEKLVSALELMDSPSPKRIAYKLADLRGIVIDDIKLAHVGRDAHTKIHVYRIERNPESDDDGSTPPTTPAPVPRTPTPDGPTGGPTDGGPRTEPEPGSHAEHAAGIAGEAQAGPAATAEIAAEAEADTKTSTQFLTELDENLRREITEARFLALDTETTGLYSHSKPRTPTASTAIGEIPWRAYKKRYGDDWNGTPRMRILSVTLPSGRSAAWDLDGMDAEARTELLRLCVNQKVLVGHNLAFDLRWIRETTGDVWPAKILDTMLLTRALAPDLSIKIHARAGDGDEEAKRLVDKANRVCGVRLEEVAFALGLRLPEGKASQSPDAWAPRTLTREHYRYATGDTEVVLEVLRRLAGHIGIKADDPETFIGACNEHKPRGWESYVEAFEPALRILAGIRENGLPFDVEVARGHVQRLEEEVAQALAELAGIAPGLEPHAASVADGGVTDATKNALVRAIASESPEIAREIVTRAVGDDEAAWQRFTAGEDVSGLKIGQRELPEGVAKLKTMGIWERVQEAVKRRKMLQTIIGYVREDGRLHATISITAVTGRTASEEPNAQNFPRDAWFRELVKAKEGCALVAADFSAIEMRVAAALAQRAVNEYGPAGRKRAELIGSLEGSSSWIQEKRTEINTLETRLEAVGWKLPLAEVFRHGVDPHVVTAILLMRASHAEGLPADVPEDVIGWLASMSPEQRKEMRKVVGTWRQRAKAANFGLLYGQQAAGLHRYAQQSYGVEWTPEEAKRTREVWFDGYPDIYYWQTVTDVVSGRWLAYGKKYYARDRYRGGEPRLDKGLSRASSTLSGRPLATFDRTNTLNYADQGSGAEIALRAVNLLPEEWKKCVVNFVHDELLLEVPEADAERAAEALRNAMIRAGDWLLGPFGIPTEVEVGIGRTWPKG